MYGTGLVAVAVGRVTGFEMQVTMGRHTDLGLDQGAGLYAKMVELTGM